MLSSSRRKSQLPSFGPPLPSSGKQKSRSPKRKQPKPDAVAGKSPPAADLKACQLEEFDAFRYAFSLPTGCHG